MFIILDNHKISKHRQQVVIVGSADECDFVVKASGVAPQHLKLERAPDDSWSLSQLSSLPTTVSHRRIEGKRQIAPSELIGIGTATLQVREPYYKSSISRRLDEKTFEILQELHGIILGNIKKSSSGLTEQQYIDRIEYEAEQAFDRLDPEPDVRAHLTIKAMKKMLFDKSQGLEAKDKGASYKNIVARDFAQFAHIAGQVELMIGSDDKETPQEKVERIDGLLPWAMQERALLLSSEMARDMSIALLRSQLFDIIFGFGPLEDLMTTPDINDIMVLPSGKIFIERKGKMQDTGRRMLTPEVSMRIVERIVSDVGRRLDQTTPMVDARVWEGSRLNAIIAPLSVDGPALTIRKFPARPRMLPELVGNRTLTPAVANFLQACILARKNIIVSGGTGSGKTTILNALASLVPHYERIITIEDTKEIQLLQPHVVYLQARPPNQEEKHSVTIRQLVSNALRMRPDRILVGECRGVEALDMLQAMNTGHDGSLTTIHANTPADALRRLEVLSLGAVDLPSRAIREQIASAIDLIIQVERMKDYRRIVSIAEVVEFDEESGSIIVEEIFCFRRSPKKRLVQLQMSELAFTGYVPTFIDELSATKIFKIEEMF